MPSQMEKTGEEKKNFFADVENATHCDNLILLSSAQDMEFGRKVFTRKIVSEMLSKLALIPACFYSLL